MLLLVLKHVHLNMTGLDLFYPIQLINNHHFNLVIYYIYVHLHRLHQRQLVKFLTLLYGQDIPLIFVNPASPFYNQTLLNNLQVSQQTGAALYVQAQYNAGQPVYVISDSHNAGPNFRMFAGN